MGMILPAPGATRAPAIWFLRHRNPALNTTANTIRKIQVSNSGFVFPSRESPPRARRGQVFPGTDNGSRPDMEVRMVEL